MTSTVDANRFNNLVSSIHPSIPPLLSSFSKLICDASHFFFCFYFTHHPHHHFFSFSLLSVFPQSLYVGDLHRGVDENMLYELFSQIGPLASVRICRDAQTRASLGYAYVNFMKSEDAQRALDTMNFQPINGQPCRIMWSHRDPTLRRSGKGNLFIKNLPKDIDTAQLHDVFSRIGEILSCKVATNSKGESLGYGFVHFADEENAKRAIELLNNKSIVQKGEEGADGEKTADTPNLVIAPFRSKAERGGEQKFTNVYVKNFPKEWTEEDLERAFGKYGKITSSKLPTDDSGVKKGFGFVNFSTHEEAQTAIKELHEKVLEEGMEPLYVARAQSAAERKKELEGRRAELQKKFMGVNLYIKNLPEEYGDEDLVKLFEQFGDITSAKVMRDESGKSRGFGFVCFSTPDEATQAVTTMNNHRINNKPLYVGLAQTKSARRAQLEAQHAARNKAAHMGMPQGAMYMPHHSYFQTAGGPGAQRGGFYHPMAPHHMQRGGYLPPGAAGGAPGQNRMMRGPLPGPQYQLMPVANGQPTGRGHPGARGPGGPNRGGRGRPGATVRGGHPGQPRPGPAVGGAGGAEVQTTSPPPAPTPGFNAAELASKSPEEQKAMLGEQLYHRILELVEPDQAVS